MGISTVIGFLFFYIIFLGVTFWFETSMGVGIISGYNGVSGGWSDLTSLFNISTGYGWLNILLLAPALGVLVYIGLAWARGVSP